VVGARDIEEDVAAVGAATKAASNASAAAVIRDQWADLAARLVFTCARRARCRAPVAEGTEAGTEWLLELQR